MRSSWLLLLIASWSQLAFCYEIVFVVLGYNRPDELKRTLANLCGLKSDPTYKMEIDIDGPTPGNEELVKRSIMVAEEFKCPLFNTTVIAHEQNRGIVGQWIGSWHPKDDQYSLIIEDDVEISPDTLYFLDVLIKRFKDDPMLYGIALQRAQWQLGICERKRWRRLDIVGEDVYPQFFRYAALGTWGQLLFPKPWSQFLEYARKCEDSPPVDGLVTEEWDKRGRRLISPVFTRWALSTGYLNLYTNFGQKRAMATSRQPPGINVQASMKRNSEGFPGTEDIRRKLKRVEDVRSMSPCFDPVDLTIEEHITQYGIPVSIPKYLSAADRKRVECGLAVHRIYPMNFTDIVPRLEFYSMHGYFKVSPLEQVKQSVTEVNVDYMLGSNLVMKLIRDSNRTTTIHLTEDDYEVSPTINASGICSKFYCPFVPGLYPDKPKRQSELEFSDL